MRYTLHLICYTWICLLFGCTLEAAANYGEKCPPDNREGEVSGAYDADTGFCEENNLCIPVGMTGSFLCTTQCGTTSDKRFHETVLLDDTCQKSSNNACMDTDSGEIIDCTQINNAAQTKCDSGKCKILACIDGYHLSRTKSNNACIKNTVKACGEKEVNCLNNEHVASASCVNDSCVIEKCETNYHLKDNDCVPDTNEACMDPVTNEIVNCTKMNNAAQAECISGKCKIIQCVENYHLSGTQDNSCDMNSDEVCGNSNGDIANCKTDNHASDGHCLSGQCQIIACIDGYHLSGTEPGNTCIDNTIEACGEMGTNCLNIEHVASASCVSGNCVIEECEKDYHLKDNECIPDTLYACGEMETNCSNIDNAVSLSCVNGNCIVEKCLDMFHLKENACYADTIDECGSLLTQCPRPTNATILCDNGTCQYYCNSGYHDTGKACEIDSVENCGASGQKCTQQDIPNSTSVSCSTGTCLATKCKSGFHLYNGMCEQNTLTNCGIHGKSCPNELCKDVVFANEANYTDNDTICIRGELTIAPQSQIVTMNNLIYAGSIRADYDDNNSGSLKTISFPILQQLNNATLLNSGSKDCSIVIRNANALTQINLPKLKTTAGAIVIHNMKTLSSIQLEALEQTVELNYNNLPTLTQISASNLKKTDGILGDDLKSMTKISFPKLQSTGRFWISANPKLTSINVNNASIADLIIAYNSALTCANMCSLKNYTLSVRIENNKEASCNLKNICK